MKAHQMSLVAPRVDRVCEAALPLKDETPQGRLLTYGEASLTDTELLALILGCDVSVARELMREGLNAFSIAEWNLHLRGKGRQRAAKIVALLEFTRRLRARIEPWSDPVRQPESLAQSLIARYSHYQQERLGAVYLDSKNRVIREREIYIGTLNATTVSTRDILRFAIQDHAASIVAFHNHPSGDPAPSAEDLVFTKRLHEAAKLLGVVLLDHLILGANRYCSLRQRGLT